jgi:hypothetical protein
MKSKTKFAGKEHDLSGYAALDFSGKDSFASFAVKFANCDPQRFEPLALRFFIKKNEPVITLYAMDRKKQEENKLPKRKLPVRKFKLTVSFNDFLKQIKQFDFTLTEKNVDVGQFPVVK